VEGKGLFPPFSAAHTADTALRHCRHRATNRVSCPYAIGAILPAGAMVHDDSRPRGQPDHGQQCRTSASSPVLRRSLSREVDSPMRWHATSMGAGAAALAAV